MTLGQINQSFNSQELQTIKTKMNELQDMLGLTINLSKRDKQRIPKLGDGSRAWMLRCREYAANNPNLLPNELRQTHWLRDFLLFEQLEQLKSRMRIMMDRIEDTQMLAGSEYYRMSLVFYHIVKAGARANLTHCRTIYDDLKKKFPGGSKAEEEFRYPSVESDTLGGAGLDDGLNA